MAIDEASVDEDIRSLIRHAATVSSPVREELFSEIGLRTDDGVSAHLRDLWNQAIDGQPYDPKQDRSGQMMAEIDHAVRRVPAVKRPRPVRFSIQAVAQHPRRCSAWLQWIEDGEPRLIGPFLTARALVTSVKARTRRLREQARRDGVIAPP